MDRVVVSGGLVDIADRRPLSWRTVSAHARLGSRVASWGWDYLVIVGWLVVLFALVGVPQLLGWWDLSGIWSIQWQADLAIMVLTVVPYFLYLAISEAGDSHATWGKRRAGLRVEDLGGGTPRLSQIIGRNLIKVLPWQLAHMGASRLIATSGAEPLGTWLSGSSMVVVAAIMAPILFARRGVHDLAAGTRVVAIDTQTQGS